MFIPPPNFTQTPNDLIDKWLPLLKEAELKVLLVIVRKTFGWHKTRDRISISLMEKLTGMNRQAVIKACKTLQEKGLILKILVGQNGSQESHYELVVTDNSNNSYQCDLNTPPQCDSHTPPSVIITPTKETITKETITKKRNNNSAVSAVAPPSSASSIKISRAKNVSTSADEHLKLVEKFGLEATERGYEELCEWKANADPKQVKKHESDYLRLRKWVIPAAIKSSIEEKQNQQMEARLKKYAKPEEKSEENKKKANEILSTYLIPKKLKIEFLSSHIEFNLQGNPQPYMIRWDAAGFEEQLKGLIHKTGCKKT